MKAIPQTTHTPLSDYLTLCKPKVVLLMVLTAIAAMFLACPPGSKVQWGLIFFASIGIALAAAAGGSINHLIDRRVDSIMARTKGRPLPSRRVKLSQAVLLATCLTFSSAGILLIWVNALTTLLTVSALIGYAGLYTLVLKRLTPQNIVIGGLAGAMPPLLGWSAVTNTVGIGGLLLVLIIFVWTPPHFWALAIHRYQEYSKANIPMLPVTHGIAFTKLHILLYTILLCAISYLPFALGLSGLIYCLGVTALNGCFLYHVTQLYCRDNAKRALATFRYSIHYLGLLFILMLLDHYTAFFSHCA